MFKQLAAVSEHKNPLTVLNTLLCNISENDCFAGAGRQDKQCAVIAARPLVEYCPFCFQLIRSRVQGLKIPRSESGTLSGFVRLKEFLDLIVIIIVVKPLPYLAAAF